MTYPPLQFLSPEQIAEMEAHNAPLPKVTKREATDCLIELRAQFENGIHPLFAKLERFFKGE